MSRTPIITFTFIFMQYFVPLMIQPNPFAIALRTQVDLLWTITGQVEDCQSVCLSFCLSACLSVSLYVCLFVCMYYLSVYLPLYLSIYLSSGLSVRPVRPFCRFDWLCLFVSPRSIRLFDCLLIRISDRLSIFDIWAEFGKNLVHLSHCNSELSVLLSVCLSVCLSIFLGRS